MGFRKIFSPVVLLVLVAAARFSFADAAEVKLPLAAFDMAVNPETGAVAVVDPENNKVALFPKLSSAATLDDSVTREAPKLPISIVYKQAGDKKYFAVVCHDAQKLLVLDAGTFDKVKEISLEISNPSLVLASTAPDDPFVYYCGGRGHDSALGRVNLTTFFDEGKLPVPDSVMDAAISADGKILYTRGPWSPSGFRALKIEPAPAGVAKPTITPLHHDHRSTAPYFPDTATQYCATGSQLYSADLKKLVAELSVAPTVFAAGRPIAAGVKNSRLVVVSLNSFKEIGSADVPMAFGINPDQARFGGGGRVLEVRNGQADFKRFDFRARIRHDPKNDCFILCYQDSAAVVKLADLKLPKEPLLTADVRGSQVFNVGRSAALTVKPRDPSVKMELKDGPKGLKLSGNDLQWTPAADDVGVASVTLRLFAGELEREMKLELSVRRPEIFLDFGPGQMVLSQNGKWIALLETPMNRMEMGGFQQQQQVDTRSSRIKVIDATKLTSVADKSILSPFTVVGVDDRYVYAGLAESDAFYVLKREDLSEVKRIFTNGKVRKFVSVGEQTLYVVADQQILVLKLPDLTPVGPAAQGSGPATRPGSPYRVSRQFSAASDFATTPQWNGVGWEMFGTEYDAPMANVRNVRYVSGPPAIGNANVNNNNGIPWQVNAAYQNNGAERSHWGIIAGPGSLLREPSQQIGQFTSQATIVLADQPAAVSLTTSAAEFNRGNNTTRNRAELSFRDLSTARTALVLPLFDEPLDQMQMQRRGRFGQRNALAARGDTIAALVGDRLFVISPPKLDPKEFSAPLHFSSSLGIIILDPDRPIIVPFKAEGGTSPIEYALSTEQPGIDINKSAGAVTLTAKPILEQATRQLIDLGMQVHAEQGMIPPEFGRPRFRPATRPSSDPRELLANIQQQGLSDFRRLTGRNPTGVAMWLPVSVIARDKDLQSATQTQAILVDVPTEPVYAALREHQRQQQEEQRAAAAAENPATRPGGDDGLERRVSQLEDRIRQLDAKIDLLTQILSDERKKQGK